MVRLRQQAVKSSVVTGAQAHRRLRHGVQQEVVDSGLIQHHVGEVGKLTPPVRPFVLALYRPGLTIFVTPKTNGTQLLGFFQHPITESEALKNLQ